ncbi:hypothetical protein J4408_02170 [Candidatus Pacearchaeota archaeon]|nr:hypothetical protein [Candidatus Pacearchaeota archaeon]
MANEDEENLDGKSSSSKIPLLEDIFKFKKVGIKDVFYHNLKNIENNYKLSIDDIKKYSSNNLENIMNHIDTNYDTIKSSSSTLFKPRGQKPEKTREQKLREKFAVEFKQYVAAHGQIGKAYQDTWHELASRADKGLLLALPQSAFIPVAQAYEFAKQTKNEEEFFAGFNGALNDGTVQIWAETILSLFKQNSIGGGNYGKNGATRTEDSQSLRGVA